MMTATISVDETGPVAAYQSLRDETSSELVDVRTQAEWSLVGLADLSGLGKTTHPVEWISFPDMTQNAAFLEQLERQLGGAWPERLFFICRSGQRSMAAARQVAIALEGMGHRVRCTNIAEGFEGGLDAEGHRGISEGWKARGLPWRQT